MYSEDYTEQWTWQQASKDPDEDNINKYKTR